MLRESQLCDDHIVAILSASPLTRKELAHRLSVSRTTVGRAVQELMESGFVVGAESASGRQGRPVEVLHVDTRRAWAVAIDVTRSHATGVIVNRCRNILAQATAHVTGGAYVEWADAVSTVSHILYDHARTHTLALDSLAGVGVGIPVPVRAEETSTATDLHPLAESLEATWNTRILIDNSLRLVATANRSHPQETFLYVGLDAGVGVCVLVDGSPVRGFRSLGGEVGHLTIPGHHHQCYCGHRGCLESIIGVHALCADAGCADVEELATRVGEHNARAHGVLDAALTALSDALAPLVLAISPERIVLGGALPRALPEIIPALSAKVNAHMPPSLSWTVQVDGSTVDSTQRTSGALAAVLA